MQEIGTLLFFWSSRVQIQGFNWSLSLFVGLEGLCIHVVGQGAKTLQMFTGLEPLTTLLGQVLTLPEGLHPEGESLIEKMELHSGAPWKKLGDHTSSNNAAISAFPEIEGISPCWPKVMLSSETPCFRFVFSVFKPTVLTTPPQTLPFTDSNALCFA